MIKAFFPSFKLKTSLFVGKSNYLQRFFICIRAPFCFEMCNILNLLRLNFSFCRFTHFIPLFFSVFLIDHYSEDWFVRLCTYMWCMCVQLYFLYTFLSFQSSDVYNPLSLPSGFIDILLCTIIPNASILYSVISISFRVSAATVYTSLLTALQSLVFIILHKYLRFRILSG